MALRQDQLESTRRVWPASRSSTGLDPAKTPELRDRIRIYLRTKGLAGDDLEELTSEAVMRAVATANRSGETAVSEQYALAVANNLFRDYVRKVKPRWNHLKRSVLAVIEHPEGSRVFGRWRNGGDWICGFHRWRGRPFSPTGQYFDLCEGVAGFDQEILAGRNSSDAVLPEILAALFTWIGTPLEIDDLVTCLAKLMGVEDTPTLSMDDRRLTMLPASPKEQETAALAIAAIAGEQYRKEIWSEIIQLQPSHRAALLLGMSREELLLVAATVSEVAAALDMCSEEFMSDWRSLPLSDAQIAERLGVTPKQVSNFRVSGRARLGRWMARSEW